jgi:hypothetical protein
MEAGIWMAAGGIALTVGGIIFGRGTAFGKVTTLLAANEKSLDKFADRIEEQINRIELRCESRLVGCQQHFGQIDKKIAAMTGKANGV